MPRYVFAGANNGIMPPVLCSVHEQSMSPRVAVLYEVLTFSHLLCIIWVHFQPINTYLLQLLVLMLLSFIGDLDHLIGYM
jgi:hypothetical protein